LSNALNGRGWRAIFLCTRKADESTVKQAQ
jgi:hypothetical protein